MINEDIKNTYESVKYKSYSYLHSSIDRLCATARVYGLEAVLPQSAKVLEIGCASGGNIIAQAINYPNAEFIGIDLSSAQIKLGVDAIKKLKLQNIKLFDMDVCDACEKLKGQEFDYIICHGVFSWVPDFVKKAILEIGAKLLSEHGVMMISYNVYPGWKYKEPTRDFMRFASRNIDYEKEPETKLDMALAALSFEKAVYRTMPLGESASFQAKTREMKISNADMIEGLKHNRSYLLHEYLEIFNNPSYLVDFVADADELGLAYIEDVKLHYDVSEIANSTLKEFVNTYFNERITKDQMFDFLYSTMFRHSMLTKKANEKDLVFAFDKINANLDDIFVGFDNQFNALKERAKGLPMEALANALVDNYPNTMSAKELKALVAPGALAEHLFDINAATNGSMYFSMKKFQKIPYEKNKTKILASYSKYLEFLNTNKDDIFALSNPLNKTLNLANFDFFILSLFDGKRDKDEILDVAIEYCLKNNTSLNIMKDGKKVELKGKDEIKQGANESFEKIIYELENNFMLEEI